MIHDCGPQRHFLVSALLPCSCLCFGCAIRDSRFTIGEIRLFSLLRFPRLLRFDHIILLTTKVFHPFHLALSLPLCATVKSLSISTHTSSSGCSSFIRLLHFQRRSALSILGLGLLIHDSCIAVRIPSATAASVTRIPQWIPNRNPSSHQQRALQLLPLQSRSHLALFSQRLLHKCLSRCLWCPLISKTHCLQLRHLQKQQTIVCKHQY